MKSPNAATGPRSAEGKARSSMNAVKTGIYSKSLVIPGEDRFQLDALTEEYYQRVQPEVPEQRDQVDILVRSTWTLRRLAAAEAQVWQYQLEDMTGTAKLGRACRSACDVFGRLQRIINSTQRNYRDALHELERLQSIEIHPEPPCAPVSALKPEPAPAPTPPQSQQPIDSKPITPPSQFVSSSSPKPAGTCTPIDRQRPAPCSTPKSTGRLIEMLARTSSRNAEWISLS